MFTLSFVSYPVLGSLRHLKALRRFALNLQYAESPTLLAVVS
jgi:hypothetical protein